MKRLYCSLRGGFGNQLFQVAHGLILAQRYGADFVVDDGWFRGRRLAFETPRAFALDVFDLPYRLPHQNERPMLAFMDAALKLQKRLRLPLLPIHFEGLPLSSARLSRESRVYLHGCWQSHAGLSPYKQHLQQLLQVRSGVLSTAHAQAIAEIVQQPDSVAVHVRRGDYVTQRQTAAVHGVCSLDYYAAALQVLRQRLRQPRLYLFSDDLAWARAHLPLQHFDVTALDCSAAEGEQRAALAEFDCMRHCRHAVIANSSFSWWAAFLLQNPESVVIAPKQWFRWGSPRELYAPDWIVL